MNRIFLLVLSLVAVVACAQNTSKDYEKDHVRLTLNDGKIIEGYIQKYWIDGKLFKRMNTTFVMSPLAVHEVRQECDRLCGASQGGAYLQGL